MNLRDAGSSVAIRDVINDYFSDPEHTGSDSDDTSSETDSDRDGSMYSDVSDTDSELPAVELNQAPESEVTGIDPTVELDSEFTCKCKYNKVCSTLFHRETLQMMHLSYLDLTREELDIAVLSKLSCGMHLSTSTST